MILLSGKEIAQEVLQKIKQDIGIINKTGKKVTLATIQVENRADSSTYIRKKIEACNDVGIISKHFQLDETITELELLELIRELNNDNSINAIMCQLPLPSHIDEYKIVSSIKPIKDPDCMNPLNYGKLCIENKPNLIPCTPLGCLKILKQSTNLKGKHVVIMGRSDKAGKPMLELLLKEDCTVSIVHSKTAIGVRDLLLKNCDIIVVAIGKMKFLKKEMIGENQIIIDIGINFDENGKQQGDVDLESVSEVAYACTNRIGGTGATTVAHLLHNTIECAKLQGNI